MKMKKRLHLLIIFALVASSVVSAKSYKVANITEYNDKVKIALPGDSIILANGVWKDAKFIFKGNGKSGKYIYLKAETTGKVFIEGESSLSISGNWLHVSGLIFREGYTPGKTVIEFKTSETDYAYNCVVSNCVIDKFNQPLRETTDNWVALWGKNNMVEYCYFGGKTNVGTTLIVCPNDSNSIHNKHWIHRNYFGPRPRLGSNGGETIRIGTSEVCLNSSETVVEGNYFEHCNGEVEIVSIKSSDNKFLNNTIFESEGSLVLRHGNRAIVSGNWFIGNGKTFTGGIRVINEGHQIYNNFFYKLTGNEFRSPLTIMNGIPNSPLSGYAPVKNVLIANNTYIDCALPWNFCVGKSERNRIVTPQSTQLINNIVYCPNTPELIISYDNTDGITLANNLMISGKGISNEKGSVQGEIMNSKVLDFDFVYSKVQAQKIPTIKYDILGQLRGNSVIGAFQNKVEKPKIEIASSKNCGPKWYKTEINPVKKGSEKGKTIKVEAGTDNLYDAVIKANAGDILVLSAGEHILTRKITINKSITIKAASKLETKPVLKMRVTDKEEPLFEISSNVYFRIKGVKIDGEGDNMSALAPKNVFLTGKNALGYSLFVDNCEIFDFNANEGSIFKAFNSTMADSIVISNSIIRDSYRGISLAAEKEDGKYNAETVIFKNTVFSNLSDYALDYYRGGNDESTVGGSLAVNHCVFDSVAKSTNQSIIKLSRIMYVKINNSIFSNSTAKSTVQLWGLYDKISDCCLFNCEKPELIKSAKSKNLLFVNPDFEKKSYSLSNNSALKNKASDGGNIGLK